VEFGRSQSRSTPFPRFFLPYFPAYQSLTRNLRLTCVQLVVHFSQDNRELRAFRPRAARFSKPRHSTEHGMNERTQEVIENINSSSKKRTKLPANALTLPRSAFVTWAFACAFRLSGAQSGSRKTSGAKRTSGGLNIFPADHLWAKNRFSLPSPLQPFFSVPC